MLNWSRNNCDEVPHRFTGFTNVHHVVPAWARVEGTWLDYAPCHNLKFIRDNDMFDLFQSGFLHQVILLSFTLSMPVTRSSGKNLQKTSLQKARTNVNAQTSSNDPAVIILTDDDASSARPNLKKGGPSSKTDATNKQQGEERENKAPQMDEVIEISSDDEEGSSVVKRPRRDHQNDIAATSELQKKVKKLEGVWLELFPGSCSRSDQFIGECQNQARKHTNQTGEYRNEIRDKGKQRQSTLSVYHFVLKSSWTLATWYKRLLGCISRGGYHNLRSLQFKIMESLHVRCSLTASQYFKATLICGCSVCTAYQNVVIHFASPASKTGSIRPSPNTSPSTRIMTSTPNPFR